MIWYDVVYRYTGSHRILIGRFPKKEDAEEYYVFLDSRRERDAWPPLVLEEFEPEGDTLQTADRQEMARSLFGILPEDAED